MPLPESRHDQLPPFPAIPYGRAYFRGIRMEGCLYVDKTRFLHALEQERFVFFIRPRRFGKTCWLSMLESYYDRNQADDFERVFGGLDIYREPTPNRGRYVVVRVNFSTFGNDPANLEREFDEYCRRHVRDAVEDHPDLFPDAVVDRIQAASTINGQLDELFLARPPEANSALHSDRRVRQLRQHDPRRRRSGGVPRAYPRRRLLPQLLRDPQGGHRERQRGTAVRHRGLSDHPGRRDERFQHRRQPEPPARVQRDARTCASTTASCATCCLPGGS